MRENDKKQITFADVQEKYTLSDMHAGNEKLFADIMSAYAGPLSIHVQKIIGRDRVTSSDDIVQETMIKLWMHKDQLKEFKALTGYVYRIATTTSLSSLKSKHTARTNAVTEQDMAFLERSEKNTTQRQIESKDMLKRVFEFAQNTLSPKMGDIFLKAHRDGMDSHEIAATAGVKLHTGRVDLWNAEGIVRHQFASQLKNG